MHAIQDTTDQPRYDDSGKIELKYHALDGDGKPIVGVSDEVYDLNGGPKGLLIKGEPYWRLDHRPLHAEWVFVRAA